MTIARFVGGTAAVPVATRHLPRSLPSRSPPLSILRRPFSRPVLWLRPKSFPAAQAPSLRPRASRLRIRLRWLRPRVSRLHRPRRSYQELPHHSGSDGSDQELPGCTGPVLRPRATRLLRPRWLRPRAIRLRQAPMAPTKSFPAAQAPMAPTKSYPAAPAPMAPTKRFPAAAAPAPTIQSSAPMAPTKSFPAAQAPMAPTKSYPAPAAPRSHYPVVRSAGSGQELPGCSGSVGSG